MGPGPQLELPPLPFVEATQEDDDAEPGEAEEELEIRGEEEIEKKKIMEKHGQKDTTLKRGLPLILQRSKLLPKSWQLTSGPTC